MSLNLWNPKSLLEYALTFVLMLVYVLICWVALFGILVLVA